MKNKRKKGLRNYVLWLFVICAGISILIDDVIDFFLGFFAGYQGIKNIEEANFEFGDLSHIMGWISMAIIVLVCVYGYRKLKKKVTEPVEQLAHSMREVSKGNFNVQMPLDGNFEFEEIQKTFNLMVDELRIAKQNREMEENKNLQLYAGIAHDLKTPMTMIIGYAKVFEQESEISKEDKKRYIETIIEQTEHANALLDSLLSYTKLENQSYQLKKEKNDIVEFLRVCVANYYPILEEAKVQIEVLLPDTPIEFLFDEPEMKRVFINLLANLVKHNPQETSCIVQLQEINRAEKGEKLIQIVVADNGPKISANLQDTLFDTFVVGEISRNTKNGSGLGLSISKKIVERHSGRLYYMDEWKEGYKGFIIEFKDYENAGFE